MTQAHLSCTRVPQHQNRQLLLPLYGTACTSAFQSTWEKDFWWNSDPKLMWVKSPNPLFCHSDKKTEVRPFRSPIQVGLASQGRGGDEMSSSAIQLIVPDDILTSGKEYVAGNGQEVSKRQKEVFLRLRGIQWCTYVHMQRGAANS